MFFTRWKFPRLSVRSHLSTHPPVPTRSTSTRWYHYASTLRRVSLPSRDRWHSLLRSCEKSDFISPLDSRHHTPLSDRRHSRRVLTRTRSLYRLVSIFSEPFWLVHVPILLERSSLSLSRLRVSLVCIHFDSTVVLTCSTLLYTGRTST